MAGHLLSKVRPIRRPHQLSGFSRMIKNIMTQRNDVVRLTPSGKFDGLTVWLTGLSGAGKSTIAEAVHHVLIEQGCPSEILDADIFRKSFSPELGFSREERDQNVRRLGYVANLLTKHGVIVIVAAISPYRATRDEIRQTIGRFIEVYVATPIDICEQRDVKGLYKKARSGVLRGLTGIDDPYEEPTNPEVRCETHRETLSESTQKVMNVISCLLSVGRS